MKVNSVASLSFQVKDFDRTAAFYEQLGFRAGKRDDEQMIYYVNWFSAVFVPETDAPAKKANGMLVYIKVDDIDEFYKEAVANGMKPDNEPNEVRGNQEFILRDPDGYQLAFFQKG